MKLCSFFFLFLIFFSLPAEAAESTVVGEACSGAIHRADWDSIFQCVSGTWQRDALWLGASSDECNSSKAGLIQWTGTSFQGCDGTSWTSLTSSSGDIPAGAVMYFNLASSPSGWALADGTNGTVDLRGEFIRVLDSGRGIDSGRTLASAQSFATSANGLKLHVWRAGSYSEHSAAFNYSSGDWAAGPRRGSPIAIKKQT